MPGMGPAQSRMDSAATFDSEGRVVTVLRPAPGMKHPYQNLWSRIAFCVERNGAAEVFLIPLRMAASPLLVPVLPGMVLCMAGGL